jgi:hypothetical protein
MNVDLYIINWVDRNHCLTIRLEGFLLKYFTCKYVTISLKSNACRKNEAGLLALSPVQSNNKNVNIYSKFCYIITN